MIKIISIVLLAALLGGCASKGPASIAGGECRIFEAPKYEVRGVRDYDQDWIDSQVEGGIGGCHWKRPLRRPASIDAAPAAGPSIVKPAIVKPAKRRGLVARIRDRVMPTRSPPATAAAPMPAPAPVVVEPIAPPAPAPRPPRSAIERLLEPREDD
jgi:hypothetical protein